MKTGHCVRCQCVKNGWSCVNCWPALSNPIRCQNLNHLPPTPIPVANSCVRSNSESSHTADCVYSEDPWSRSSAIGELLRFLAKPTRILKEYQACLDHLPLESLTPSLSKLCLVMTFHLGLGFSNSPCVSIGLSKGVSGGIWLLQLTNKCPKRTAILMSRIILEALEDHQDHGTPQRHWLLESAVRWRKGLQRCGVACSKATTAEQSASTVEAMKLKHPPRYPNSIIEDQPHSTQFCHRYRSG